MSRSYESCKKIQRIPVIESEWWRVCEMPDLGELKGQDPERQHIVDHGFIHAKNGKWILWACVRGTKVGRLIYGWEGGSLEEGPWQPLGIVVRAQAEYGEKTEPEEKIGAPFFLKYDGMYYCFYHTGDGICLMTSDDGKHYTRNLNSEGKSLQIRQSGRDFLVVKIGTRYFAYSTISTVAKDGWPRSFVIVRTSENLKQWSDYTIVSEGGIAGNGAVSAESPFVVELDGYYYLFRATSTDFHTYVYRSTTPYNFGVQDDSRLIARLPIKAPEIICHDGRYYISDLADFQGIKLAKLRWDEDVDRIFDWSSI